jgi:uroporphyrinogen-III synthase
MSKILEIQVRTKALPLSPTARRSLAQFTHYDWILFTSKNTVAFFAKEIGVKKSSRRSMRVGAVGPETARALRMIGYVPTLVPERSTVQELLKILGKVEGARILFPRSNRAPHETIQALRTKGARVRVVPLYTTVPVLLSSRTKRDLLTSVYTFLSFKSPSGVQGLMTQLNSSEKKKVRTIPAICIGPTTADAARAAGFKIKKNVLY